MKFSFEEQVDMILIYEEIRQNSIRAQALYAERYPHHTHSSHRPFQRLCKKLKETGNLGTRETSRRKRASDERNEVGVLAIVAHNPQISPRQIERESGIGRRSVLRILARHIFYPYHISVHQNLHGTDFMNRVLFCQWALHKIQMDETFFSSILFTDEARFTNHGNLNLHNMHYWSTDNSHWLQVENQRQWSVNVWCGIVGDQIIGPHFIDGNLTGEGYEHFIRSTLGILLENVPLNVRQMMWLQQDGCPAHYAWRVTDALNELYPNRWIACAKISAETTRHARDAAIRRLQLCIDAKNGHHIEHLL
ncbi:hypothetical protein ANTQUA_LOCUS8218 [Anthophora quadrimaculata]